MLGRTPVTAIMLGILGLAMLVPCIQAIMDSEWRSARGFLYAAIGTLFAATSLGFLLRPMKERESARHELFTLLFAWILLPVFAAIPVVLLLPSLGNNGAWFEMVAALTTTGGTSIGRTAQVPDAIHLWRGIVGWLGGLLTLTAAYVILAPRKLGGFEVMVAAQGTVSRTGVDLKIGIPNFQSRTARALREILPFYLGATAIAAIAFNALDKPGLTAAVHAMSIVSTSGISPLRDGIAAGASFPAELIAFIFMVLAATRLSCSLTRQASRLREWPFDPELRLMLFLTLGATVMLYLRHWVGVLTLDEDTDAYDGLIAFWGALFTCLSFLTTTGFESFAWESAQSWSGLENPGLVLMCLCMIGGGAATTAGGIKLIRSYALIRHGTRELERIALPNSVAGMGSGPRELRREGAFIAWAFLMLFVIVLMTCVVALTMTGLRFEKAMFAAVAALSNTGPAYSTMIGNSAGFAEFGAVQRGILAVTMILGRIEALAFIALFNLGDWSSRQRN